MENNYNKLFTTFEKISNKLGDSYAEQRLKSELMDCKRICKNELLRNELIQMGYDKINNNTSIDSGNYFTIGHSVHFHKNMILWLKDCSISWPDTKDMKCITGKYYVLISFSTGPYYIIQNHEHSNENYNKAIPLFREMWNEIISYQPDATDSHNHSAYFEIHSEGAVKIWNEIDDIIKKHVDAFDELIKNDKLYQIKLLKEQIKRLEND